jgi:hypothetical protein
MPARQPRRRRSGMTGRREARLHRRAPDATATPAIGASRRLPRPTKAKVPTPARTELVATIRRLSLGSRLVPSGSRAMIATTPPVRAASKTNMMTVVSDQVKDTTHPRMPSTPTDEVPQDAIGGHDESSRAVTSGTSDWLSARLRPRCWRGRNRAVATPRIRSCRSFRARPMRVVGAVWAEHAQPSDPRSSGRITTYWFRCRIHPAKRSRT